MDDAGMCAGIRPLLGVYLTGAIAPADRAVVVRHLAACADCRAELAGLATDYCVAYSALDAIRAGFAVTVLEDACRGIDLEGSLARAMKEMRDAGVVIGSTADVV